MTEVKFEAEFCFFHCFWTDNDDNNIAESATLYLVLLFLSSNSGENVRVGLYGILQSGQNSRRFQIPGHRVDQFTSLQTPVFKAMQK